MVLSIASAQGRKFVLEKVSVVLTWEEVSMKIPCESCKIHYIVRSMKLPLCNILKTFHKALFFDFAESEFQELQLADLVPFFFFSEDIDNNDF